MNPSPYDIDREETPSNDHRLDLVRAADTIIRQETNDDRCSDEDAD